MNRSSSSAPPPTDAALYELAAALGAALRERGLTLATAESCTGGWIAKAVTDVPGSSVWFRGAAVTYSNEEKIRALGVPAALIERDGAVSEAVVRRMAEQVRSLMQADLAVAVSGVAGPDGGTPGHPVGTVWLAWAQAAGTRAERQRFAGPREAVRRSSVARALAGLAEALESA